MTTEEEQTYTINNNRLESSCPLSGGVSLACLNTTSVNYHVPYTWLNREASFLKTG